MQHAKSGSPRGSICLRRRYLPSRSQGVWTRDSVEKHDRGDSRHGGEAALMGSGAAQDRTSRSRTAFFGKLPRAMQNRRDS
ncbi:MAG: hypothetical protein DMG30_01985 [Acidobacteria bacterium]|nr:MAG: hypothetical protein DMG30_01985 [Acidobacteriota bacterium]